MSWERSAAVTRTSAMRASPRLVLSFAAALLGCAGRYAPVARCPPAASPTARRDVVALVDSDRVPVEGAPRLGPADAPVTVVVFSDFECPYCNRGRSIVHDLRATLGDRVRVVWRNLPLARHAHARMAAEAAMEVHAQLGDEAFWRLHDILFAHQQRLDRDSLEGFAALVGADLTRLRAALDAHTHSAAVDADVAMAERLGVDGTPAFVVNGTRIDGAKPLSVFESLATTILARASDIADPRMVYAEMVRDPLPAPEAPARGEFAQVHDVAIPVGAPARGGEQAAVVVQVFSDFQCPFCARVVPTLRALEETYGDRLRIVWRDFPLPFHANATQAAEAAREALAQRGAEGFWRFHDALFAHQDEDGALTLPMLEATARAQGLDAARMREALRDHRHLAAIRADVAAASATGVRMGTPAFFVNGHFMSGARPLDDFRARIDGLLAPRAGGR